MHEVELVTLLFGVVLLLAAVARRLEVPYPIVLVLGGIGLALLPGLPVVRLEPQLVFFVFLPPILWAAAYFTSWRDFKRNLRPISLLAFGLVLFTTAAVALVARAAVPGIPWAAAVALGAIVSPPDAVAAVAVLRRLRIPHRALVVLEGESLVNDATALVVYRAAAAALAAGGFELGGAAEQFLAAAAGGVAVGLAVAGLGVALLRRIDDRLTEIAVTLLAPYVAWALGERLHASAVLACVAGGLLFRRGFSTAVPPATRLQARAVWDLLVFALNGVIFILIGLQLRTLGAAVGDAGPLTVLREGLLVSAAVIVARLVWVPVAAVVPRLVPAVRRRDPMPPWSAVLLVAWTGMRGVVSLAAALALPLTTVDGLPLPFRERIILITFVVVVVTLVLQGLTLPPLIRLLRLPPDDTLEREQATALAHRLRAGRERLEELAREPWAAPDQLERLRQAYRRSAAVPVGGDALASSLEEAVFKRARYETLLAERQALIRLRDAGAIGEEVLSEMEAELDREAARHGLAHIRHYPPAPARGTGPGG